MNIVISNKYKILKKIGEGAFGKIFISEDIDTKEKVAIKIEKINMYNTTLIKNEACIYTHLKDVFGIPNIRGYGKVGNYNYLIMDLFNKSLENKISINKGISTKLILDYALQMICRIEDIHNKGIIHRDIKPDNFLLNDNDKCIYLIDFGLSKSFLNEEGKHITLSNDNSLLGTLDYVSINIHNGITASRRDDMESIGYILMYLFMGNLPWKNINFNNEEDKNNKILELKININYSEHNIPDEFILYINYCRSMKFEDKPNYNYLKCLLYNLYKLIN